MSENVERGVVKTIDATDVAKLGYSEFIKYTSKTRSYPNQIDGLKTVYRRILYASREYNKITKALAIVGSTQKYHPHGDASISGALVSIASNHYSSTPMYDVRGNWGGLDSGPAAMRYIRCGLNDFGRLLMGDDLMDYAEYDTEDEYHSPKTLPMYLPYAFLEGDFSMATGMPTPKIPKLNKVDMINFYIATLEGKPVTYPRIDEGDVLIISPDDKVVENLLRTGKGTIQYQSIVDRVGSNSVVVTNFPPERNLGRLLKVPRLRKLIDNESVFFNDLSAEDWKLEFSVEDPKEISVDELQKLITHQLTSRVTYNMLFVNDEGIVYESTFKDIVDHNIKYLKECVVRKYGDYLKKAKVRYQVFEAITTLRNDKSMMSKLVELKTEDIVKYLIDKGFSNEVSRNVVSRPISYLTRQHDSDIKELESTMTQYEKYITNPEEYLLPKYHEILSRVEEFERGMKHTTLVADASEVTSINSGKVVGSNLEVVRRGRNKNLYWDNVIYVFDNEGKPRYYYPNIRVNTTITPDELEMDTVTGYVSDKSKYVVFIEGNDEVIVRLLTDAHEGRDLIDRNDKDLRVIGSTTDKIRFTTDKGKDYVIDLTTLLRSRKSRTWSVCNGERITKWEDVSD